MSSNESYQSIIFYYKVLLNQKIRKIEKIEKDLKQFEKTLKSKVKKIKNPNNLLLDNLGYVYLGEDKMGLPHGLGTFEFNNEDIYFGESQHGLRHGIGSYTYFSNKDVEKNPFLIPSYSGEWFGDFKDGTGKSISTLETGENTIYEGDFAHDLHTGFGRFTKNDKDSSSEMIGYFFGGSGFELMLEFHKDSKGNLLKDVDSGLFQYDSETGGKELVFRIKNLPSFINLSANLKEEKEIIKSVGDNFKIAFKDYFDHDHFSQKFKLLRLKIKKNTIKTLINSFKESNKNIKNKEYIDRLTSIVDIYRTIHKGSVLYEDLKNFEMIYNDFGKELKKFSKNN